MVTWKEVEERKRKEIYEYLIARSSKKKHFTLALQYKYGLLKWEEENAAKDFDKLFLVNVFPIFAKENGAVVLRFLGVKDGVVEFFKVIGKRKEWKDVTAKELLQMRFGYEEIKGREFEVYGFKNFWDNELIEFLIKNKVEIKEDLFAKVNETFKRMGEPLQSYYLQTALLEHLVKSRKGVEYLQEVDTKKIVNKYIDRKREGTKFVLLL